MIKKCAGLLIICLSVLIAVFVDYKTASFLTDKVLMNGNPVGTAPRTEVEYKLALRSPENLPINSFVQLLNEALTNLLQSGVLQADKYLDVKYELVNAESATLFRDVYYDNADWYLLNQNIAYRTRHRWSDLKLYKRFVQFPKDELGWPTRAEIQSKIERISSEAGLSQVQEARLEFRLDSHPFNSISLPPKSPWIVHDMKHIIQKGFMDSYATTPAYNIANELKKSNIAFLALKPRLTVLAERWRFHLKLNVPWGTGPNPHHAFIVTLDHFLALPLNGSFFDVDVPFDDSKISDRKLELEIELERNVMSGTEPLALQNNPKAIKVLELLRQDQKIIKNQLLSYLSERGVGVMPQDKSKYRQSYEMIHGEKSEP